MVVEFKLPSPLQNQVTHKVHEIARALSESDKNSLFNSVGVMGGASGVALFYLEYSRIFQDPAALDRAGAIFEDISDLLLQQRVGFSFTNGLAGIAWLFRYAEKNSFFELDSDELLAEIEAYLAESMMQQINQWNYDFLHGALGVALYFLPDKHPDTRKKLELLIKAIEERAIIEEDGSAKWEFFKLDKIVPNEYNLGLSHGIPSILSFLTKAYRQNLLPGLCKDLVQRGSKYILKNEYVFEENGCFWPYSVRADGKPENSRLAWCYGDLGIAYALWQGTTITGDSATRQKAINVLKTSGQRRSLYDNMIYDAGLCHGAAGVAHIYRKMYTLTGEPEFADTARYWFEKTLELAYYQDGLAGYKRYLPLPDSVPVMENAVGFLEGVSGVGLSLIAASSPHDSAAWDEILLL